MLILFLLMPQYVLSVCVRMSLMWGKPYMMPSNICSALVFFPKDSSDCCVCWIYFFLSITFLSHVFSYFSSCYICFSHLWTLLPIMLPHSLVSLERFFLSSASSLSSLPVTPFPDSFHFCSVSFLYRGKCSFKF